MHCNISVDRSASSTCHSNGSTDSANNRTICGSTGLVKCHSTHGTNPARHPHLHPYHPPMPGHHIFTPSLLPVSTCVPHMPPLLSCASITLRPRPCLPVFTLLPHPPPPRSLPLSLLIPTPPPLLKLHPFPPFLLTTTPTFPLMLYTCSCFPPTPLPPLLPTGFLRLPPPVPNLSHLYLVPCVRLPVADSDSLFVPRPPKWKSCHCSQCARKSGGADSFNSDVRPGPLLCFSVHRFSLVSVHSLFLSRATKLLIESATPTAPTVPQAKRRTLPELPQQPARPSWPLPPTLPHQRYQQRGHHAAGRFGSGPVSVIPLQGWGGGHEGLSVLGVQGVQATRVPCDARSSAHSAAEPPAATADAPTPSSSSASPSEEEEDEEAEELEGDGAPAAAAGDSAALAHCLSRRRTPL